MAGDLRDRVNHELVQGQLMFLSGEILRKCDGMWLATESLEILETVSDLLKKSAEPIVP